MRLQSNKLKTEPFRLEKFTRLAHVKYEWVIKELIINSTMTFCHSFWNPNEQFLIFRHAELAELEEASE